MGRQHSEETRRKISEGLKRTHERKRIEASPTAQRAKSLAGKFAEGHPEHLAPSRVRNYGDFGRDLQPMKPERRDLTTPLTREQRADVTTQEMGLNRAPEVKARKAGEHMKTRAPVIQNTASPRDRDTLIKQQQAHKMRVEELKRIRGGNGAASS